MSDFVEVFGDWLVDGTVVETLSGDVGIEGRTFATPVAVDALMIDLRSRMMRNAQGVETLSTCTLYVDVNHPARAAFTLGSRVTFADGKQAHVIEQRDFAPYGVVDHLVVACE